MVNQSQLIQEGLKGAYTGVGISLAGITDGITRVVSDNELVVAAGAVAMGLAGNVAADDYLGEGNMAYDFVKHASYGHQGAGWNLGFNQVGLTTSLQSDAIVNVEDLNGTEDQADGAAPEQQTPVGAGY